MSERLPGINQVRERIYNWHEDKVRHALMYQLMICGRPSEVTGKYKPDPNAVTLVKINKKDAVLFPVRTAKRKGKLRPVALPIKHEPWAEELYEVMREKNPFPSGRTVLRRTEKIFQGMSYPIEEYDKTIKKEGYGDYFSFLLDEKDPNTKHVEKVEAHWREARRHFLRHVRAMDLMNNYGFNGLDLAVYGGWSSSSVEQQLPAITQRYLHLMANEVNIGILTRMAERYFPKLCKEVKT